MLGAPQDPRFDASILSRSLTRPPQKRNGQFTDSMSQAESWGRVPKPRPPPPSATRAASPRVPVCRFGRPPRGGALTSSHARKPRGARGAPSRRGSCNRVGGWGGKEELERHLQHESHLGKVTVTLRQLMFCRHLTTCESVRVCVYETWRQNGHRDRGKRRSGNKTKGRKRRYGKRTNGNPYNKQRGTPNKTML